MAVGVLIYLLYGRTHSEVNNPRLINEPMRVVHENFSVEAMNQPGYTDEYLMRQYQQHAMPVRRESGVLCSEEGTTQYHGSLNMDVDDDVGTGVGVGTGASSTVRESRGGMTDDEQSSISFGPTEHSSPPPPPIQN